MGVSDLPTPKVPHRWCDHCIIGLGCSIYEQRPKTCREFECVWLQDTRGLMDEAMRPDKLRVVFQPTDDGCGLVAHCDPGDPMAWRRAKSIEVLRACARAGFHASARVGDRYWLITKTMEWPVPDQYLRRGPHGKVDVHVPHDVALQIGIRAP